MSEYYKLMSELTLIKKSIAAMERNSLAMGDWIPQKVVMRFFDYCDNQLRQLEKTGQVKVSKIGRRKFYSYKSIISLIEKNKK